MGEQPPFHVFRGNAREMWKDNQLSNPNYLLATTHKFWWGDNSYRHQCFSSIPPELAKYRQLASEEFDGQICDVVESPTRQERLWFSQDTGQLRGYLKTNLAVYNLNLWMHTLVELWAWDKSREQLVDRNDSPWDDAERRPSHANRRQALRRQILRNELSTITTAWSLPRKIIQLAESLMALAA